MCYDECNFKDTASAAQILCPEKGSKHFFKGVLELSPDEIEKLFKKLHKTKKKNLGKKLPVALKKQQQKLKIFQGEWQQKDPKRTP